MKTEDEKDKTAYKDFTDYGYCFALEIYSRYQKLPAGYWVYLYTHWHIWSEKSDQK